MDRADRAPAMGRSHAGHSPIARSTAPRRRSISARPAYCRCDVSSWLAPLDELLAERVPDVLEQLGIARRLTHLDRVARPRKVHLEHVLDLPGPRREQDDTVGQRQGFAE